MLMQVPSRKKSCGSNYLKTFSEKDDAFCQHENICTDQTLSV